MKKRNKHTKITKLLCNNNIIFFSKSMQAAPKFLSLKWHDEPCIALKNTKIAKKRRRPIQNPTGDQFRYSFLPQTPSLYGMPLILECTYFLLLMIWLSF